MILGKLILIIVVVMFVAWLLGGFMRDRTRRR